MSDLPSISKKSLVLTQIEKELKYIQGHRLKLKKRLDKGRGTTTSIRQWDLMSKQHSHMLNYENILQERMADIKDDKLCSKNIF